MRLHHALYTTVNSMHGKASSELNESLVAKLIANNSRITRMEFCGNVLGELNVVTIMWLSTTLCVSFSSRSNNCAILSSPVYNFTSPSSQSSVLPVLCLHFCISVKLALGSSGSLSTLLQHLRQVSPRFFLFSVYISVSPSSQPSILPALCLHFYSISVKLALGSSCSLSTLLYLRQVSPRFFRLSVYTSTSPSSQPPVLSSLCLHCILHRHISPH
jgi:hypothetical protein